MTFTAHPYDEIAPSYDALWSSPEARAQDCQIMQRINYTAGGVLDIGCGTGLFLDHYPTCNPYLGLDPSEAMLLQLEVKHPMPMTICQTLEDALPNFIKRKRQFDLIIALYGTASYIAPQALSNVLSLLSPSGRAFLMFYAPDYTPATHRYISAPPTIYPHDPSAYGTISSFDHYIIAET